MTGRGSFTCARVAKIAILGRPVTISTTGPPTSAAVSPPAAYNRHAWLGETSRFDNVAAGKWRETFPKQPGHGVYFFDEAARTQVDALKDLTWVYVVMRPSLAVMQAGRKEIIRRLCQWYWEATEKDGERRLLPPAYQARLDEAGTDEMRSRLVNDLVSGLTEEAALTLFRRMSGVDPGSVIDATAQPR